MSTPDGQPSETAEPGSFAYRPVGGTASAQAPILLAGVGNLLMSDDGVGVHALTELQKDPIPGVTMIDIGTAILHGLSFRERDFDRPAREKMPADNPWGFRMPVPELLYNKGELYNLGVARGTLSEEERYKIN